MAINKVKGTYDVLPSESAKWQALEETIKKVLKSYHIQEIRTPMMEYSEVFHRNSEASDMVTKETYDFLDRGQRKVTLRPEGTAGVMRSYVENKLYASLELEKVFYIGPNFRYERPQKGRYRQFSQFGVEAIGATNPVLDAEMIMLAYDLIQQLGLTGVKVRVNSLGDEASSLNYRKALIDYFTPHQETLCQDCQRRIEKNPLRILDCKVDGQKDIVVHAPTPIDYLSDASKAYFNQMLSCLDLADIDYELAPKLVRGLDYYSHTVFEIEAHIEGFGAQNVLGGGGRYEHLVSELGGPKLGGIGFAFGMERLLMALEAEGVDLVKQTHVDVYAIVTNQTHQNLALKYMHKLRKEGYVCDMNYTFKSFKGQLKHALKLQSKFLLIFGEEEVNQGLVGLKDTQTEEQTTVKLSDIILEVNKRMEKRS